VSQVPFVHLDVSLADRRVGDELALPDDDRHHLRVVLRLGSGADVEVADGRGGLAPGRLTTDGVALTGEPTVHTPSRPRLVVAQGLPKARKLDDVVRLTTELGTDAVVPVAAARSVVRLEGERAVKAVARWRAVARAAAEQARRPTVPEVALPVSAARLPAGHEGALLVAHPGGTPLSRLLTSLAGVAAVTVAVGPEGGWDDDEVDRLEAAGGRPVGLGPTVLRTEHAAAAAVAVLAAGLGRWDR
jgi:16S rRNA (uracil1498-N3)-methyltransferase